MRSKGPGDRSEIGLHQAGWRIEAITGLQSLPTGAPTAARVRRSTLVIWSPPMAPVTAVDIPRTAHPHFPLPPPTAQASAIGHPRMTRNPRPRTVIKKVTSSQGSMGASTGLTRVRERALCQRIRARSRPHSTRRNITTTRSEEEEGEEATTEGARGTGLRRRGTRSGDGMRVRRSRVVETLRRGTRSEHGMKGIVVVRRRSQRRRQIRVAKKRQEARERTRESQAVRRSPIGRWRPRCRPPAAAAAAPRSQARENRAVGTRSMGPRTTATRATPPRARAARPRRVGVERVRRRPVRRTRPRPRGRAR